MSGGGAGDRSAQITATEHEQLQRMANVADRSLSAEIRRALRSYLEQGNEHRVACRPSPRRHGHRVTTRWVKVASPA